MVLQAAFLLFLHALTLYSSLALGAPQYCKPVPGSPHWPAAIEWQNLNETINGHLVSPVPPGSVCQPTAPDFNNASCAQVIEDWGSSDWHAKNPFTSDYSEYLSPDFDDESPAFGWQAGRFSGLIANHISAFQLLQYYSVLILDRFLLLHVSYTILYRKTILRRWFSPWAGPSRSKSDPRNDFVVNSRIPSIPVLSFQISFNYCSICRTTH